MTTCIVDISTAAHSAGLFVSADVITNWQGPWYTPSQSYVDQFNLMTYGDDLATVQQDVADTISQGLPASKFAVGVDVDEHPQPPGGCGQFSKYAAQAGLAGAFVGTRRRITGTGISARTVSPQAEAVARAGDIGSLCCGRQSAGLADPLRVIDAATLRVARVSALSGLQGRQDSNLQPPVLETGALPVELRPWVALRL